ncbi:MAG: response regulator [Terracidiphilus sp.]
MATILVVENDPLQAFARVSSLQKRFQNVQRVADAAEALCLIEQPNFAINLGLVICCLHMPGVGGPAFVAELHDRLPAVPVLVLGSLSEPSADYATRNVRFLSGPSTSEQVLSAASQMLGQSHHKTSLTPA